MANTKRCHWDLWDTWEDDLDKLETPEQPPFGETETPSPSSLPPSSCPPTDDSCEPNYPPEVDAFLMVPTIEVEMYFIR